MQKQYLDYVLASHYNSALAIVAANAISVLNCLPTFSFSGLDLHGIRVPRADLSGALLYSVDFTGADLSGVSFLSSCLGQANLRNANLENAEFADTLFKIQN
eukprot:ANDGO_04626.mRNA.1 hypothetical protein PTSG_05955